jgi:hypothetical protein
MFTSKKIPMKKITVINPENAIRILKDCNLTKATSIIVSKFNHHPYISEKRRMHICFNNYSFETCRLKLFDFFIYLISSMKFSSNKSYGPK